MVSSLPDSLKPEIRSLGLLLDEARSASTVKAYSSGFKRFVMWAELHGLSTRLPIAPLHCALYLLSLIQTSDSISPVTTAFYSVRHVHVIVGLPSPTDNTLVKNVLEAGKRRLAKPVTKKEPVTVSLLCSMFSIFRLQLVT